MFYDIIVMMTIMSISRTRWFSSTHSSAPLLKDDGPDISAAIGAPAGAKPKLTFGNNWM